MNSNREDDIRSQKRNMTRITQEERNILNRMTEMGSWLYFVLLPFTFNAEKEPDLECPHTMCTCVNVRCSVGL